LGKSGRTEGRLIEGLNGRVGKIGEHLQVFIREKESGERGKREQFEEGEKEPPLW